MLILLPLISLAACVVVLRDPQDQEVARRSWVRAFLMAAAFLGAVSLAIAEGLGVFGAISQSGFALGWLVVSVILGLVIIRRGVALPSLDSARDWWRDLGRFEQLALAALAILILSLLGVGLISPPNNVDSFIYHMTRVVHWAQNGSLAHYPAAVAHQLLKPIMAEVLILHLRLLWGSDRVANLVQWFSMVGSLFGVAEIARLLGASRRGRLAAAAFVVAIPMGVLQSTSTQNDYVAAFWAVGLAFFAVLGMQKPLRLSETLAAALCFALGTLTKGTFFAYGPPLALLLGISELRRGLWRGTRLALLALILSVVLNLPFWLRNVATYGGIYGSAEGLDANLYLDLDTGAPIQELPAQAAAVASPSVRTDASMGILADYLTRLAQMMGRNLIAPVGAVNKLFLEAFSNIPWFGNEYADEMRVAAWNHEDTAGNPIHLTLALLSLPFVLVWSRRGERRSLAYASAVWGCYLLIPVVISHGPSLWGIRYQLPFFVLYGPVVGTLASRLEKPLAPQIGVAFLLFGSLPWILLNNTRPLIGMPPWPTAIRSVLIARPPEILLATNPRLLDDYESVTAPISRSTCTQVGLKIESNVLEYPFWWLLEAPQSGRRLEVINLGREVEAYRDPLFVPCAVICSVCEGSPVEEGLPRVLSHDTLELYMDPGTVTGTGSRLRPDLSE